MPIHRSLWRVGASPQALREAALPSEALPEAMIVAAPEILSREWMIIGRQKDEKWRTIAVWLRDLSLKRG